MHDARASICQVLLSEWEFRVKQWVKCFKLKLRQSSFLPHHLFEFQFVNHWHGPAGDYLLLAALFFGIILFRQLKKSRNGNLKGLPLPPSVVMTRV